MTRMPVGVERSQNARREVGFVEQRGSGERLMWRAADGPANDRQVHGGIGPERAPWWLEQGAGTCPRPWEDGTARCGCDASPPV
jgi:hypothetical protein